jgi:hypothetical protein
LYYGDSQPEPTQAQQSQYPATYTGTGQSYYSEFHGPQSASTSDYGYNQQYAEQSGNYPAQKYAIAPSGYGSQNASYNQPPTQNSPMMRNVRTSNPKRQHEALDPSMSPYLNSSLRC